MPKITGQSIPPDLEAIYAALTSPGKITQGADGTIRLKKGKTKPGKKPPRNLDLLAFYRIAEIVAEEAFTNSGRQIPPNFVYLMVQDLVLGIVSTAYFRRCKVELSTTLESIPVSSEDLDPPPYGYRTVNNWPTVPVYPDGSATSAAPGYAGQKVGTLFKDTYWRWRKLAFSSRAINKIKGEERVLLKWAPRVNIDAGSRGSRPMLSLFLSAHICGETGSAMDSLAPPLHEKYSFYWRFKIPPSSPPYYHSYQLRNIVKPFARIAKKSGSGLFTRYLLNAANRPMLGRGFNNNDTVTTSFQNDPELWEVTDCFPHKHERWLLTNYSYIRQPRDIAYSPTLNKFCACADGYAMLSSNLDSWAQYWMGTSAVFWSIIWADYLGMFIMGGGNNYAGHIMTSSNGTAWASRSNPATANITTVAVSNSLGIVVAFPLSISPTNALWSENGINWNLGTANIPFVVRACVWVESLGYFVASGSGSGGYCSMTSPDGKTWAYHFVNPGSGLYGMGYSPDLGLFVATTDWWPGRIATSTDGMSWSEFENPYLNSYNSVAWCPPLGLFIMSGGSSGAPNMLASSDGVSWSPMNTGNTYNWYNVRWMDEACALVACSPDSPAQKFMKTAPNP